MSRPRWAVAALAALALAAPRLAAQVGGGFGFDTGVWSRYQWRGLTRRNGAVWQTDLFAAVQVGRSYFTLGGWTSIELAPADPRIDEAMGLGRALGEIDGWVEWSYAGGRLDAAVGYTRYAFPERDAAEALGVAAFNTGELYARVAVHAGRLAARGAAWYDPEDVKGAYLEGGLAYELVVLPVALPIIRFGVLAGVSAGQEADASDPPAPAYFAEAGLTHLDLSVEAQVSFGIAGLPLYLLPALHLQVSRDDAAKVVDRTGRLSDTRFWFGLSLSWHRGR
jgi:hypothetical protein